MTPIDYPASRGVNRADRRSGASVVEHVEQFADGVLAFERMTQRGAVDDPVVVPTTDLLPSQLPTVLEVVENPLHGPGRDADHVAQIALA